MVLEDRPGFISLHIEGKGAKQLFKNEAGGHRWQIVSPTDKRGRMHTSTVTVAVLEENKFNFTIKDGDIEYLLTKGSGPGGMNRNKVESCVVAVYKPTGLSVRIDARDQHKNKAIATRILTERIIEQEQEKANRVRSNNRKDQVGRGMRADKRRTYRSKDDSVIDHVMGKSWTLKLWMRGKW